MNERLAQRVREILTEEISSGVGPDDCVNVLMSVATPLVDRRRAHALVEKAYDEYHGTQRELAILDYDGQIAPALPR